MRVFIRADASARLGTGHVMRCLALAGVLKQRGADITFLMRDLLSSTSTLIQGGGFNLRPLAAAGRSTHDWASDAAQTRAALEAGSADWLIVDHYDIDATWEDRVRTPGLKILVVDDLAVATHRCDILLNQNLLPEVERRYRPLIPRESRLLAGPRYALLRPEFRVIRSAKHEGGTRIFVGFGGSDPDGVTLRVLDAIARLDNSNIQLTAVLGAANPHRAAAEKRLRKGAHHKLLVQPESIAMLMAEADFAVGGGGISLWERCCAGLPSLVVAIAANQVEVARAASQAGGCVFIGPADAVSDDELDRSLNAMMADQALRASIAKAGMQLVDGFGCERVAAAMLQGVLAVRAARLDDGERIFAWRNSEQVRKFARDSRPLVLGEHMAWFSERLAGTTSLFLIGEVAGCPIGVLRYDIEGKTATVSIYVDPGQHGLGYGRRLLDAGEQWLRQGRPDLQRLHAEVLPGNAVSHRLFTSAGYSQCAGVYQRVLADRATSTSEMR